MKLNNIRILFLLSLSALLQTGCGGKDIHPEAWADPRVLSRGWALTTHGPFEAGDRGTEFSNPVILENALIFGNQSVGLISLYPGILQVRWTLPIAGGVISELAFDQGNVFMGGGDGNLYSVAADTGKVNWRYDLHNPLISKPTLSGGRVFVTTSDDTVYAFDQGTGKWLWHYRRRSSPTTTILGASAPLVDGNEVLTGLSDGFLVSLSLADGQLKWEKKLHQGTKFTDVDAHPILEDGTVYVPSYDGALYALKRQGGATLWRFDSGGAKEVVLEENRLFLPSSDGNVYCLEKRTGKVIWKFELDGGTPTQLASADRYIIVGSSYRYLYVLEKDTGKIVYRYSVGYGSGFYGSPVYDPASRRVYFLSGAGNLYAFNVRKPPRKIWPHGSTDPYIF